MEIFRRRTNRRIKRAWAKQTRLPRVLRQPHVAAAGLGNKPREKIDGKKFDANGSLEQTAAQEEFKDL